MKLRTLFGEAWRSLGLNPLRSGLTTLGMVIGVGAVVLMLAVGQGAQSTVNDSISAMGSRLFIILSGASTAGGMRLGSGTVPTLTVGDAQALAALPSVARVGPVFTNQAQLAYGPANWGSVVYGTTPDYFPLRDWSPVAGRLFDAADLRSANRVVVLGQTVARNLFGLEDPVGRQLRIRNVPFEVLGVLDAKGQSLDGRDQDDAVFIPLSTAQTRLFGNPFPGTVRFIMVQAAVGQPLEEVAADLSQLLRQRHRLGPDQEDDFTVRDLSALAATAAIAARTFALMLGAIASISLLVGGIGIMNIMLVAVTERTREIGIRLAVGARRRDILGQFLLEAVLICTLGGLLGVLLGVGGAWLLAEMAEMVVVVDGRAALLATLFSGGVGVFFGLYPARKAAGLRPVEALRFE